jgi:hypothetical protein
VTEQRGSSAAAVALLLEVEALLKDARLGLDFGRSGVNTSIALCAVQGLIGYLEGNKRRAVEDLSTAADEIRSRLEQG